jgi:hypothetical protein
VQSSSRLRKGGEEIQLPKPFVDASSLELFDEITIRVFASVHQRLDGPARSNPKARMISSPSLANSSSLADPPARNPIVVEAMTVMAADVEVSQLLGEPPARGRQQGPDHGPGAARGRLTSSREVRTI